uniref:Uncharacterized protein n=1 Tax=viral metagenome TaxID=1070528 RepID=A0A6M3L8K5_9ZZZZ
MPMPNQLDILELIKALPKGGGNQGMQINPMGLLSALSQSTQQQNPLTALNALASSTRGGLESYQPKRTEPQDQSNWARFADMSRADAASRAGDVKREDENEKKAVEASLAELAELNKASGKVATFDQYLGIFLKNGLPLDRAKPMATTMFQEQTARMEAQRKTTLIDRAEKEGIKSLSWNERIAAGLKEEKPKNKVVDYFMPDKQGGYTKESVQIPEDAYNDTIKQIRSSGGFLRDRTEKKEKPQANVDEYGRTPKDLLMHRKSRLDHFNKNYEEDSMEEMEYVQQRIEEEKVPKEDIPRKTKLYKSEHKALAKKRSDTGYDAALYGWPQTRFQDDKTGEIVEIYRTPKGKIDVYGNPFPSVAKPDKPTKITTEPPPNGADTKDDIAIKPEAEKVLTPKEKQMSKAANKSPYLRTAAEQKVLQEASNQEIKNVLSTLPGIAEKITGTIYKGITPRKEDTAYLKRLWDMLLQGQKESREALGR